RRRARRRARIRGSGQKSIRKPWGFRMTEPWWISLIKAFVIINLLLGLFAYMTWVERKLIGRMQRRYGPTRVGPFGLLQPIALLGSMRTCAQMVSYEVSLTFAVLGVVITAQSLSLVQIVHKQGHPLWYFIPQAVGLAVFFVAGIAETNRAPFDLPEAETELVA